MSNGWRLLLVDWEKRSLLLLHSNLTNNLKMYKKAHNFLTTLKY